MQKEVLQQLLEKFHANQCTEAELEMLREWYETLDNASQRPDWDVTDAAYLDSHYEDFRQRLPVTPAKGRYVVLKRSVAIAAAVAGVLLLIRYFHPFNPSPEVATSPPLAAMSKVDVPAPAPDKAVAYDRHLVLPDSSVVLLQAGSTLELAPGFNQKDRQLTLHGEAFFDVKKQPLKPFIIHAAGVNTYVLGTAFNIKTDAVAQKVIITVANGKVRVEREHRSIAVLTQNQELVYSEHQPASYTPVANIKPTIQWMARDLLFNEMTLAAICNRLAARYQVTFNFDTQINKGKRVTITDAFYGTESITDILDIVCTTLGYTYSVTGNTVTITTI